MSGWRVSDVIESLLHLTSASESKVITLSGRVDGSKTCVNDFGREEIDRILSRNHGDVERDVDPRWSAKRYLDDYDKEEDVRDRDTRDQDYDPSDTGSYSSCCGWLTS